MPVIEKLRGRVTNPVNAESSILVNSRIVDSSNVEAIAWPTTGEPLMIVKYKGSDMLYGYIGVSRQRAVAAAYAKSTGVYINSRIKGHFEIVKLGS